MRHTLPPSAVQGASPALPEAEAVLLLWEGELLAFPRQDPEAARFFPLGELSLAPGLGWEPFGDSWFQEREEQAGGYLWLSRQFGFTPWGKEILAGLAVVVLAALGGILYFYLGGEEAEVIQPTLTPSISLTPSSVPISKLSLSNLLGEIKNISISISISEV